MKFYFVKWNTFQKYDFFFEELQVKVKPKFKVMLVFLLYRDIIADELSELW